MLQELLSRSEHRTKPKLLRHKNIIGAEIILSASKSTSQNGSDYDAGLTGKMTNAVKHQGLYCTSLAHTSTKAGKTL